MIKRWIREIPSGIIIVCYIVGFLFPPVWIFALLLSLIWLTQKLMQFLGKEDLTLNNHDSEKRKGQDISNINKITFLQAELDKQKEINDSLRTELSKRSNSDTYSIDIENLKTNYLNKIKKIREIYDQKVNDAKDQYEARILQINQEKKAIEDELKILNSKAIYKYYDFTNYSILSSEECKNKLLLLKQEEKQLRDEERDINNVGLVENPKKIRDRSIRQILRNFNSECDNIIMGWAEKNLDYCKNKISKSYETLNKMYRSDGISLTPKILELKLKQANLIYTYELKRQQEKEIQKAIKEQMAEEARAEKEIQEQKKKIEKDLQQHLGEVNRLIKYMQKTQIDAEKQLYIEKIKELEEKIKLLEADKEMVLEREANAKAGFVYIISNIGSFGDNVYKIGMTRRMEPMKRIDELSSASVPFEFDVHAMIFSSDAPELENTLHKHFADKAVNKVNPRKEFFNVSIDEIEDIVKKNYNDTVQFTKIPVAREYRETLRIMEEGAN